MAARACTYSVLNSGAAEYLAPTLKDGAVRIMNMDNTNGIWLRLVNDGGVAAPNADECVFIPGGRTYYANYQLSYNMIAIAGNVSVNMESASGRSW
jgi:hypothetical protein